MKLNVRVFPSKERLMPGHFHSHDPDSVPLSTLLGLDETRLLTRLELVFMLDNCLPLRDLTIIRSYNRQWPSLHIKSLLTIKGCGKVFVHPFHPSRLVFPLLCFFPIFYFNQPPERRDQALSVGGTRCKSLSWVMFVWG